MNPVIGLDISKGQSQGQTFLDKGKPYGKSFSFLHTQEGLHYFFSLITEVTTHTGQTPTIILESTGHYQAAVVQFLEEHDIFYIVVNPLISNQAKKSSLRKVKTDAVDAYQLCELYYVSCIIRRSSKRWAKEKAQLIMAGATRNPFGRQRIKAILSA
jgi:transposase